MYQSTTVQEPEFCARLFLRETFAHHRCNNLVTDAGRSRARAKNRDTLLAEFCFRQLHRRQQPREGHRARSLDVVIKSAQAVRITLKKARSILLSEVLPLQQDVREFTHDSLDKCFDERIVLGSPHALVPPAQIERIGEKLLVISS